MHPAGAATGTVTKPQQETSFAKGRATVNFTDESGQHCLELQVNEQLPNLIDAEKLQLNYTDGGEGLGFEVSSFVNDWANGGASTRVELNGQTYADPFQRQCRITVTKADTTGGVAARVSCTDVPLLEDTSGKTVSVEAVVEASA